jgi:hypothetical protein
VGEPVFLALLFADRVIVENNGKKGLIGVFNRFRFPSFPATSPPWFLFAVVSNIAGKHSFSFNLTLDEAQIVVLPIGGELDSKDPGAEIELIVPIRSVSFPKAGAYTMTMNIDGRQVAAKTLQVQMKED